MSSARNYSGLADFPFVGPCIASSISNLDGTSSRGTHLGHCLTCSTIRVFRVGDFMARNLYNHLAHRSRICAGSRSSLTSSSLIFCKTKGRSLSTSIPFIYL